MPSTEVSPAAWRSALPAWRRLRPEQRALCLAARLEIDSAARACLEETLARPLDWPALTSLSARHEVLPLVGATLGRPEFAGRTPDGWLDRARRSYHATLSRTADLGDELAGVLSDLEAAGVTATPVKGLVLGERVYRNPALRPSIDLDVLVQPADLPAARRALVARGYRSRHQPSFEELVHQFHDPQYFRAGPRMGYVLELHRALWAGRFFGGDAVAIWRRARPGHLFGRDVLLLSVEDTLLHLAIHRTRSALRLRWVCDVAELVRSGVPIDWPALLGRAGAVGARTALAMVLGLAADLLGAARPPEVRGALRIGRIRQAVLDRTCGVEALFGTRPGNVGEAHLTMRLLEQDGLGHIVRALGYSLSRTGRKYLHETGLVRLRRGSRRGLLAGEGVSEEPY